MVKDRNDQFYLSMARYASIGAAALGLALVPVFDQFGSIYLAHGAFIAAVTPPMAVAICFGFLFKRFTPAAAFATLLGGLIAMVASTAIPELIAPFAHGVPSDGNYKYMRALYGLVVAFSIS